MALSRAFAFCAVASCAPAACSVAAGSVAFCSVAFLLSRILLACLRTGRQAETDDQGQCGSGNHGGRGPLCPADHVHHLKVLFFQFQKSADRDVSLWKRLSGPDNQVKYPITSRPGWRASAQWLPLGALESGSASHPGTSVTDVPGSRTAFQLAPSADCQLAIGRRSRLHDGFQPIPYPPVAPRLVRKASSDSALRRGRGCSCRPRVPGAARAPDWLFSPPRRSAKPSISI